MLYVVIFSTIIKTFYLHFPIIFMYFCFMKKAGRPSSTPKRLKDGYYMLVTLNNAGKPIRIMSDTHEQMKASLEKYKNHNCKYIGRVKDHFWIDGDNIGKSTT